MIIINMKTPLKIATFSSSLSLLFLPIRKLRRIEASLSLWIEISLFATMSEHLAQSVSQRYYWTAEFIAHN